MYSLLFNIFLLMSSISCICASTCEEAETAHVKMDLARQSISNAKLLYPKCEAETGDSNCSVKDKSLALLNTALDLISEAKPMCHPCPGEKVIVPQDNPMDCSDIKKKGHNISGVYRVWPRHHGVRSDKWIQVYCDMETSGGGWTVIQRRGDFKPNINFYKDWEAYKKGFGDLKKEFWLGNEKIFSLTNQGNYSVRFDLVDAARVYKFAIYASFSIGDENSNYVLHIQSHSGNVSNDMKIQDGTMFSTKDRQNDRRTDKGCAVLHNSAFWYHSSCYNVDLNGIYNPGMASSGGIWWYYWIPPSGTKEGLYSVEIKIKRFGA